MTTVELGLALLVLLLAPGPTNTLVMLAAAERGFLPALRLIPVEVLAYLAAVLPFLWIGAAFPAEAVMVRPLVAMLAAAWVLRLAWVMWQVPPLTDGVPMVTAGRLFVTTLLNPKAIIMGVVLLPMAEGTPRLVILTALIAGVASLWALAGGVLPGAAGGSGLPPALRRGVALWLAGLSVMIVAGGLRA